MIARSVLARRLVTPSSLPALTRARCLSTSLPRSLAQHSPDPPPQSSTQRSTTPRGPTIVAPLPSLSSTLARLLPSSVPDGSLRLGRPISEDIIGKVLDQLRKAADAKTVEDAKAGWAVLDAQIRSEVSSNGHPASALTELSNTLVASSADPRRHPIAFNLYRIAFGSDPSSLPDIEIKTEELSLNPSFLQTGSASSTGNAATVPGTQPPDWGDWQSAYHWASLILQGRAPPPPGTMLLVPGQQRAAQSRQSAAAFGVFAHLAAHGHPRGIFGIGRHLLSTLQRGVDPTAMGAMPSGATQQNLSTKQETIDEVIKLYRLAGEGGVEEAWFELGALFVEGKWVRKDDLRARSFLEEGVERGSPRACQVLAHMLARDGQPAKPPGSLSSPVDSIQSPEEETARQENLKRAVALLEKGAELGSAESAFSAGMRYLLQLPNPSETDSQQAAQQSASLDYSLDPSASRSTKTTAPPDPEAQAPADHLTKWGVDADDAQAAKWFSVAADGGNTMAMMNLARMHLEGRVTSSAPPTGSVAEQTPDSLSQRHLQLLHSSDLYSRILAKAMGPEGQRAKALAEVQAKMAAAAGRGGSSGAGQGQNVPEPGMSAGSGRLDDLGVRAEEGLRLVREEMELLRQAGKA